MPLVCYSILDTIISASANLNDVVLEPSLLFDIPTEAGQTYLLVAKESAP